MSARSTKVRHRDGVNRSKADGGEADRGEADRGGVRHDRAARHG